MKARSRQAPVRPTLTRAVAHSAPAASLSTVAAETPQPAAAWEFWLDRVPVDRRLDFSALAMPGPRGPLPLAQDVNDLLSGRRAGLPVAPPRPVRESSIPAVARAWASPDVCLWQREPRSDGSAPLAELLGMAVRQGMRTLLVAASAGTIDRLAPRLAADSALPAIHFRAGNERSGSFALLARFGLEEQRLALRSRLLPRAAQACAERRARRQSDADTWQHLADATQQIEAIAVRATALTDRLAGLRAEVERESHAFDDSIPATGPFSAEVARVAGRQCEERQAAETAVRSLRDQLASQDSVLAAVAEERSRVAPDLADFRAGRWWKPRYWTTRMLQTHDDSLALQEDLLKAERDRLAASLVDAEAKRSAVAAAQDAEFVAMVDAEIGRRRSEVERQLAELLARRTEWNALWHTHLGRLRDAGPAEPSLAAHATAHSLWLSRQPAETTADVAIESFLNHLPWLAPLVFGTKDAIVKNADFAAASRSTFDLVVIEGADQFTQAELLELLGRASRALLVGAGIEKSAFAQLWESLHREETPAAYQWTQDEQRLVCTLLPLGTADAAYVESERLADFPEIELRILSAPKQPPRLAQVIFPATYEPALAKKFIYRELQEAAVDRVDRPIQMVAGNDQFTLAWECPEKPPEILVELEPGLAEAFCVHDSQITTCRLVFQRAEGWDDAKIHDWLRRHLPAFDAPRTAIL